MLFRSVLVSAEHEPIRVASVPLASQIGAGEASTEEALQIHERELHNGQIAFFTGKNDQVAKDLLEGVCRGRAKWNSRSQRWICDDDRALEIKEILSARLASVARPSNHSHVSISADQITSPATSQKVTHTPVSEAQGGKPSRKAGELVAIAPGISKRLLPDGRVAFLALKDDAGAIERLRKACKGRGQWKALFGNWVCDGDAALLVEQAIAQPQGSAL